MIALALFLLGVIFIVWAMFAAEAGNGSPAFLLLFLGLVFMYIGGGMNDVQAKKEWMAKCVQHELEYKCEALYR